MTTPDAATPPRSPAAQARSLMAGGDAACLTTLTTAGWPYPSLVLVALACDGAPLLLLSALAEHTRNLAADDRAGLLFDATVPGPDRLTGARLSLLGRMVPDDNPDSRARYLARHPGAGLYADFTDFRFWRFVVDSGHLVAGFGRIHRLSAEQLVGPAD